MSKKKIAILGGGIAALASAYELTSYPNWQDEYEVTVYQLGWRLGGKMSGGIPVANRTSAVDCVLAGLTIQRFMNDELARKEAAGEAYWQCRLGIHTGPVIAGVVGKDKFAYDIWGDTINTASRMESSGEPGRVNVSEATYGRVKDFFTCTPRGNIAAKGKGEIAMYFVEGIQPDLSVNGAGKVPNEVFLEMRRQLQVHEEPILEIPAPPRR